MACLFEFDGLGRPLHQQIDGGAAGILPFETDAVGDILGLVGVTGLFQLGKQRIEPLGAGGKLGGGGRGIDGCIGRLRDRAGIRHHNCDKGKDISGHAFSHGGKGIAPWPKIKSNLW